MASEDLDGGDGMVFADLIKDDLERAYRILLANRVITQKNESVDRSLVVRT